MILVFGGTTEGRKAAEVLEESGNTFYYSTKTGEQELSLHNGTRTDGAMDRESMITFCHEHNIRLIVDAAHPFANQLHLTVASVAEELRLPAIRFERIFPPRDPDLHWIDDYSQIPHDIPSLLATTGVQSIKKLKPLEAKGVKVYYRILPRPSSIALAKAQGATEEQLCFYENGTTIDVDAAAILMKESGLSGGFTEKVDSARRHGMKIFVLKRPKTPSIYYKVNGEHGLRRAVEKLLPEFFPLHSGLTTGTCATAAAVAVVRMTNGETPKEVPVILPNGETIMVPVGYGKGYAFCIKQAGDDPDVTDGIEVRASFLETGNWEIVAGEGIGHFTLPGFDYPPGEPAINKGPRDMLRKNLAHQQQWAGDRPLVKGRILLSVPSGATIAQRTFNPRLGIEGGISIIGISGIVKPFSEEAFINSIRKCMQVAKASGCGHVVINSGGKSERFVKGLYPTLPRQSFVEYGNYIGQTLKIAKELGFEHVTLGVMLGKAVKLAEGQLDTHSKKGTMNLSFVQQMLNEAQTGITLLHTGDSPRITLARELWSLIPGERLQAFADTVLDHCLDHCRPLFTDGDLTILLIDENGNIYRHT